MAEDEPDEELDDEIAALEEEIAALEEGEADEPADPEPDEPDEDDEGGMLGGIVDRFSGEEDAEADDDADEAPSEADEPSDTAEDEGGFLGGLTDRFGSDAEEDEAPEPEPPEDPLAATEAEETEETEAPEHEPAESQPPGSRGEEARPPEPTPSEKARSDRWEETEDGWRRRDPDEVPARAEPEPSTREPTELAPEPEPAEAEPEDEDEDEGAGAAALLSRFKGDQPEGERLGPPRAEPEEDEGGGLLFLAAWILAALVVLALIGTAAVVLLGGGGEDVQASVTSPALEQDGVFVTATGAEITFDASGSSGPVDSYEWDFGDGETATTDVSSTTHAYSSAGSFTVTVTALGDGSSSEATLDVRVVEAPEAVPEIRFNGTAVAEPGTVGNNPAIGDTVTLDASGSTADDSEELTTYEWDTNGDGEPDATGEQATTSFDEAGAWDVELTVTDSLGNTNATTRAVHVAEAIAFENETLGPAGTGEESRFHNITVDTGRGGAVPVQLYAELVYESTEESDTLPDTGAGSDLDVNVTSPAGTTYEAEEDDAGGREELTVDQAQIDAFGTWAYQVSLDVQNTPTGAASETEYTLAIRVVY